MLSRIFIAILTLSIGWGATIVVASEPVPPAVVKQLTAMLEVPSTGLKIGTIKTSELTGLYEVQLIDGPLVYATARGDYFLVGDLFSVGPGGYVNLADKRREVERVEQLATVDLDDMIIFSPEGETRATITVFTDISCFYCQKLHKEVPELNKQGVEVRYLAYPRAGVDSAAFRQLASAWCATNKQETLTRLKSRETVPDNVCPGNPIAEQYLLGQKMGVRGTPAIVTDSGQMIPGYRSAEDLIVTLGLK